MDASYVVPTRVYGSTLLGFKTISKWMFLAGNVLFLVRIDLGVAKPTEYVYSLGLLFALIYILTSPKWAKLSAETLSLVCVVVYAVLLGTAWLAFRHGIYFEISGIRLLLKLFLNVMVFVVVLIWFKEDKAFYKKMVLSLSVPYVFYFGFFVLPEDVKLRYLDAPDIAEGRFIGMTNGVGGIAFPIVEAFAVCYVMWLDASLKRSHWRFPLAGMAIGFILLELWSASRIGLAAMASCVCVGTLLYKRGTKGELRGVGRRAVLFALVGGVILYLGLQIGYWGFAEIAFLRIIGSNEQGLSVVEMIQSAWGLLTDPTVNVRLGAFNYYKELVLANPFVGMGVNYYERYAFEIGGEQLPPDTFLDSFIHGGILLVASMLLLLVKAVATIWRRTLAEPANSGADELRTYRIAAATALAGNCVFAVFGGFPIYSLRFWVILAMCLA